MQHFKRLVFTLQGKFRTSRRVIFDFQPCQAQNTTFLKQSLLRRQVHCFHLFRLRECPADYTLLDTRSDNPRKQMQTTHFIVFIADRPIASWLDIDHISRWAVPQAGTRPLVLRTSSHFRRVVSQLPSPTLGQDSTPRQLFGGTNSEELVDENNMGIVFGT
jgi:hypothetical protein